MARGDLIAFTEYTNRGYVAASHHHEIALHLQDVERGDIDRLMIIEPPRHGKSELASRRFPAYYLGRNPTEGIVAASYNSHLAMDFGRDVRNIVASQDYGNLFSDVRLSVDSKAADRWHTSQGGSYVSAGVGTAVTGRDASLFLIDDPLKDREEANSQIMRDRLWNWYSSVVQSRLPKAIILIQTRWHEDDLAGRLIQEMESGGDQWTILHHPAISDSGAALWGERYPLETLERTRRNMNPRDWTSLFQGRPAPEEGDYFKREWVRWYESPPKHLRTYGASDYAVTGGGGDFTVHGVAGVDPEDNLYILDWWRGQTASDVWIEVFLDFVDVYKPLKWAEESGQIIKSVGPFIDKRMRERKTYANREQFPSARDKPTRARSFQARMAMGKVYFPRNKPWATDLVDRLMMFPAGTFDDETDVLSLFGRMLDTMVPGRSPDKPKPRVDRWDRAFEDREDSWRTA